MRGEITQLFRCIWKRRACPSSSRLAILCVHRQVDQDVGLLQIYTTTSSSSSSSTPPECMQESCNTKVTPCLTSKAGYYVRGMRCNTAGQLLTNPNTPNPCLTSEAEYHVDRMRGDTA